MHAADARFIGRANASRVPLPEQLRGGAEVSAVISYTRAIEYRLYCPFLNALISHVCIASWRVIAARLARTQHADVRQGTVSATSRAQAGVQNFHLGSNVIPAEMRGCVLASRFSHLPGEDKVSGQQADG